MEVCRVCMTSIGPLSDIFVLFLDGLSVAEIISRCLNIKLSPNDKLTKKICRECTQNARIAYNFRQTFADTHLKLSLSVIQPVEDFIESLAQEEWELRQVNVKEEVQEIINSSTSSDSQAESGIDMQTARPHTEDNVTESNRFLAQSKSDINSDTVNDNGKPQTESEVAKSKITSKEAPRLPKYDNQAKLKVILEMLNGNVKDTRESNSKATSMVTPVQAVKRKRDSEVPEISYSFVTQAKSTPTANDAKRMHMELPPSTVKTSVQRRKDIVKSWKGSEAVPKSTNIPECNNRLAKKPQESQVKSNSNVVNQTKTRSSPQEATQIPKPEVLQSIALPKESQSMDKQLHQSQKDLQSILDLIKQNVDDTAKCCTENTATKSDSTSESLNEKSMPNLESSKPNTIPKEAKRIQDFKASPSLISQNLGRNGKENTIQQSINPKRPSRLCNSSDEAQNELTKILKRVNQNAKPSRKIDSDFRSQPYSKILPKPSTATKVADLKSISESQPELKTFSKHPKLLPKNVLDIQAKPSTSTETLKDNIKPKVESQIESQTKSKQLSNRADKDTAEQATISMTTLPNTDRIQQITDDLTKTLELVKLNAKQTSEANSSSESQDQAAERLTKVADSNCDSAVHTELPKEAFLKSLNDKLVSDFRTRTKRTSNVQEPVVHQKIYLRKKLKACDLCDKRFFNNTDLRSHLNVHAGLRPFQCKFCDSAHASPQGLKQHLLHKHKRKQI